MMSGRGPSGRYLNNFYLFHVYRIRTIVPVAIISPSASHVVTALGTFTVPLLLLPLLQPSISLTIVQPTLKIIPQQCLCAFKYPVYQRKNVSELISGYLQTRSLVHVPKDLARSNQELLLHSNKPRV